MLEVTINTDSRYKINRKFIKSYIQSLWKEYDLPSGIVSVSFVGSRKSRQLSKRYMNDDKLHPVLTFPHLGKRTFPGDDRLLGEIVICFSQVVLFAAQQDKQVDRVICQFLDHAVTILSNKYRKRI